MSLLPAAAGIKLPTDYFNEKKCRESLLKYNEKKTI